MSRLPFLKVAFLSVVGSFLLMLGLMAFPATASAYTGNNDYSKAPQRGQINAFVIGQSGSSTVEVRVFGSGFRPGFVFLSASANGHSVRVVPVTIRVNRNGTFSQVVFVQLNYWRYPTFQGQSGQHERSATLFLRATNLSGQSATDVLFLNQPYQGSHYGRIG